MLHQILLRFLYAFKIWYGTEDETHKIYEKSLPSEDLRDLWYNRILQNMMRRKQIILGCYKNFRDGLYIIIYLLRYFFSIGVVFLPSVQSGLQHSEEDCCF